MVEVCLTRIGIEGGDVEGRFEWTLGMNAVNRLKDSE